MRKRRFLSLPAAAMLAAVTRDLHADAWPTRPVRLVVPFPAGGPADVLARMLADKLVRIWGQQVYVDNKPGGATVIGAVDVAKSAPDGHTLLVPIDSTFTMNPQLFAKLPYDPLKDFVALTLLATQSLVLLVNDKARSRNFTEFLVAARAAAPALNYGSGTVATQLAGEMFNRATGSRLVHVPYKGSPDVVRAMLSGEIEASFDGIAPNLAHIQSGRLLAIATTGLARTAALPDVPTLHELGLRNYELRVWLGLAAPAGTPASVASKINTDVARVLAMADIRDKLLPLGFEPSPSSQEQFVQRIREDSERLQPLIRELGIRLG